MRTAFKSHLARWSPTLLLAGYFLAVVHLNATYDISPATWAWLGLLHLLLALAIWTGLAALDGIHWTASAVGSLVAGALATLHLREQSTVIQDPLPLGLTTLFAAAVLWALARFVRPRMSPLVAGVVALVALVLFGAATAHAYRGRPLVRWQLLRQDRVIGTPAFYLLSDRVRDVQERHYGQDRAVAEPRTGPAPAAAPPAQRPHIVFIMVDTLRADGLASHGADPELMPSLNAFAARSLSFQDVIVNSGWTRPSVATYFTGLLPEDHGAMDRTDRIPDARTTLAERLRDQGYETQAFMTNWAASGKEGGFGQGFDEFRELRVEGEPYMRAQGVTDLVERWLLERQARTTSEAAPLFLYVHYLDPHTPYRSGGPGMAHDHDEARESYDRELRYTDEHVSRLIETVQQELDGRPTHILLTSDHGEQFGEHGERGHAGFLYREVIHVPAVLHTPDGVSGRVAHRLEARDFHDLLAGIGSGAISDPRAWARQAARDTRYSSMIVTTKYAPHRPYLEKVAMRLVEHGDEELIWSAYGPTRELYDLATDPGEHHNLLLERPNRVEELSDLMHRQVGGRAAPERIEPSKSRMEQLRALGYAD